MKKNLTIDTTPSWKGIIIKSEISHKKLTEKKCLEIGGHCWNYHSANECVDEFGNKTGFSYTIYYPEGESQYRTCKHCGKRQVLSPEEWHDR